MTVAPASSEESVVRGVLARALLNVLRADPTLVGVVLDVQTDARGALDHLVSLTKSLGVEPEYARRTNGQEEFHVDRDRRIRFFNRRSAHYSIRGSSMDVLYVPGDWLTPERAENIYPALSVRAGDLELY